MPATPTIGWRKDENGVIMIWDLPAGPPYAPLPAAEMRKSIEAVQEQWGELCREIGARHQLPEEILEAMIHRESGGNPRAFRVEKHPDGTPIIVNGRKLTGVGLGQITSPSLKGNHTDEELFDPRLNIEIMAKHTAWLMSLPTIKADIPSTFAAYNAGSVVPSNETRWGMHATGNHIDAEVQAYNWLIRRKLEKQRTEAMAAVANQFNLQETLESGHVTLIDEDEVPPTDRNT